MGRPFRVMAIVHRGSVESFGRGALPRYQSMGHAATPPGHLGENPSMADRAGKRNRRTAFPGRALLRIASRLVVGGHTRTAVGLISRLTLLLAIVYAFAGPVDQMAMVAGVSAAPPPPARQSTADQDSGFAVADGPI